MTSEELTESIQNDILERNAREARRREGRDIHYTSKSEQKVNQKQEKSHNAVKGTLASVGVGAKEGAKNTAFNTAAFVQNDLGAGKATGLQTAERAVNENIDYDSFMNEMADKYGKIRTFWPIRMSQDERDVYASLLQKEKLGINDVQNLEEAQREQAEAQRAIEDKRRERSLKSQAALRAVDDKYELGTIGEFTQEVGGALGQMLPSLAVGVVNPAAGLATMGVQAAAQGYGQALDEGASHEQAARYGAATAAKEVAIERLTGGLGRFYGKGVLDKAIRMQANDSAKHVLANTAKGMLGEGAEEAVSGFLDPFIQRATYNPSAENATAGELAHQAAIGAALGGILGGGSNVLEYGVNRGRNTIESGNNGSSIVKNAKNTTKASENDGLAVNNAKNTIENRQIGVDSEGQKVVVRRAPTDEDMQTITPHIDERDYRSVGSRKIKAFSYEHPEVRPFYVTEAERMKRELQEAEKPSLYFGRDETSGLVSDTVVGGHGRIASEDIAFARDELGMSYAQIEKALDDIIEDSGRENSAGAKRMEILFDNVLSMGEESDAGYRPPSAEYVKVKHGIAGARDYGYGEAKGRYENGEYDPINDDPYALQKQVWALAERKGHELTADEETELQILQDAIDSDREAFSSEQIESLIDNLVQGWAADNPAKSPYEQAMDSMLKGEDGTKSAKVESEDDRAAKRFIQSAAVNARLGVEYRDMPLNQKAYYKDGKIYINQNRSLSEGMKSTVAHEIYHALEGSKEHDKIVELALKNVGEGAIQEKIAKYGEYGIRLDENGARAEIGADFIERALTDEATINEVLLENRTLASRILERIKDMIAVYKAKKNGMSEKEAEEYKALLKARRLYEDGLRKLHEGEYEPAGGERNARYQAIKRTDDGRNYVEVEDDFLAGVPKKDWGKVAMQNLAKKFPNGVQIGNNLIKINADSRSELRGSEYSKYLYDNNSEAYYDKMSVTNNADELLQSNRDYVNEGLKHKRKDNIKNFGRGKILFKVGDNTYSADMVVGNKANGSMVLYDIVNMQPEKFQEKRQPSKEPDYLSSEAGVTASTDSVSDLGSNVNSQNKRFSIDESVESNLEKRLSGDDLLNAQDMIEEIESAGGEVDKNGYVTVYHATNRANADKIKETGKMTAKEDGLFFSTKKDGEIKGYGDSVVELKIPVEKLVLDDVFDGELHFKMPLKNKNAVADVRDYLVDGASPKADMRYSIDDVDSVRKEESGEEKVGYRFFDNTFQNTPIFDDAVKEIERSYEHERARVSEKENIAEARRRLKENGWHKEIKTVLNKNSVDGADTDVAMAIISQLNNYSSDSAEFGRIMKFAEDYADKTVESGQFIQSLAKYSRTPVGKTEKAMRDIKREERRLQESNPKQWNDVEKKASKARKAYKEAQEEAATEATEEAIERTADSVDIESAEKIVNTAAKERKNRQKNNSKDKQDNSAERLAAKVQSHITPKSDTVDNAKFQRDVINELYKLAKESPLPDKAINVQKKDYVKIMREILHNQEKYEDVWQDAREILGKRYKDDAEKMSALEGYFDNFIVPVYSEDSMRVVLRDTMKELGLDVRGVLASSKSDKASTREKVREVLAEKLGLDEFDEQTVDVVTNDIFNTYDKMLKEKAEKKLEKFLDDEVKDKKKSEPLKKQMMRMVRNGTFDEDEVTRIIKKAYDVPSLTTEETREILSYYEQADAFAEGSYDRRKWEAKAQKIIADKAPKTFSEKNKTLRRIAMLTNPATWERNIVGNVVFSGAEALKNLPAGLVDMGVAKITGKRTTSANIVADAGAFAKGFARGGKEWWEDIKYGVDTSHGAVREEYQGSGSTFSDKHLYGRLANKAETVMSKALQIGDRPFYEAAYDQRINELKRLGYDTNSEAIKAETEIYALERVYQNDSKISKALTNVRNELGLFGHFLVPFTQTPGNLLDKCIDYSGVGGLARAVYQLGAAKKTGVFDQKVFVDRIGRALTGVGMLTFGAFLGSKGLLIGTEDEDYKVSGAKRLAGEKEYSLHIGDHYYTIDWAQPVSAILIAGAEAHKAGLEQDDLLQIGVASGKGVINTLFAMSCLEGLESMMSSYGDAEPADKIADVFVSGVSQYFPTALRRLNNIIDPVQRQTYSANPLIKEGKYLLSGVPGASYLLEPKYTLEGDVQYKSQGRNAASRVVENFLSPANVGVKYASEVNDELLRIYEKTGAKSQFLHYAQKKLDYGDGGKYVLAAEDYNRMQKEIGINTVKADKELMHSSVYKNMSDDDKAEALGEIATFYDNKFKEDYAKKNEIDFNNLNYESLKKKVADAGGWANYFEVKNAFPDSSYESAKKRKEKCDKYGIDYTAYAESSEKISDLKSANTAKFKEMEAEGKKVKSSDKTEANKRAIAKYLAGRKDLTNPQKQVIWQEYYSGKSSESYISVARRCGFI